MKLLTKQHLINLIINKLPISVVNNILDADISDIKNKKYYVLYNNNGKIKKIHFGHPDYEDFTQHGSEFRRKQFINRWKNNKNKNNVLSPLFYSYHVLW